MTATSIRTIAAALASELELIEIGRERRATPVFPRHGVVTPHERLRRHGHRPAVGVSESAAVLCGLQRALFERGAAVIVLQSLPAAEHLRDLLANGLILLAPPAGRASVIGFAWLRAADGEPRAAVRATLRNLEREGVLPGRDLFD